MAWGINRICPHGDRQCLYFSLFAADICAFIRLVEQSGEHELCLTVFSFVWKSILFYHLVWFSLHSTTSKITLSKKFSSMPLLKSITKASLRIQFKTLNMDFLFYATVFAVYWFIWETDFFNKQKSVTETNSVCGCYRMTVLLSKNICKSLASARVIKLSDRQTINVFL